MVTYTDADRIRKVLPKIVSTVMDDTDIDAWITKAESIINSKVSNKYTVPFTATIPGIIASFAEDITAYYIMRTQFTQDSQNKSEWLISYEKAISDLNAIRDGKQLVVDSSGDELEVKEAEISSTTENFKSTFDEGDPENWATSESKLSEIDSERNADD